MQRERLPLLLALGQQLERPADHPAVELLDHARALRRLDERRRRQQRAVFVGHPQQQLVALDPARGEAADRLRVQAQPFPAERVADPRRGRLAPLLGLLGLARVAEQGDLVAPVLLRPVHRLVGRRQHRLGAAAPAAEHRDADADRRADRVGRAALAFGHLGTQVFAQRQRAGGIGLRHQHGELVAGEAGDDVGAAYAFAKRLGDLADQVVAGLVAERVVDRLEPVDVDDHHRALAAVAGAEGDVLVELAAEAAPVEQPGERVVVGQIAQLGLGPLGLAQPREDDLAVVGVELRQRGLDLRTRSRLCNRSSLTQER